MLAWLNPTPYFCLPLLCIKAGSQSVCSCATDRAVTFLCRWSVDWIGRIATYTVEGQYGQDTFIGQGMTPTA